MGTRVSQYVHFIIYQTATETRGGGCDRLQRKEKRGGVVVGSGWTTRWRERERGDVTMSVGWLEGGWDNLG